MTSRSKSAVRICETEIERSREESNWQKAIELAHQLKARSPQHGRVLSLVLVFVVLLETETYKHHKYLSKNMTHFLT